MEIRLTRGLSAVVEDADSDLAECRWYASVIANKRYANRNTGFGTSGRYVLAMHRVILERMLGRSLEQNEFVDHIDGDGLNNRRSNLRLANRTQNNRNAQRPRTNTSGYKGVTRQGQKWTATISVNNRNVHLGTFETPEEAYKAYCDAAIRYHGDFARFG